MVTYGQTREDKRKKRGISIKLTAYHEAGHAVMAYILRVRLIEVTIIPDEDDLGKLTHGAGRNIHPACIILGKRLEDWAMRIAITIIITLAVAFSAIRINLSDSTIGERICKGCFNTLKIGMLLLYHPVNKWRILKYPLQRLTRESISNICLWCSYLSWLV